MKMCHQNDSALLFSMASARQIGHVLLLYNAKSMTIRTPTWTWNQRPYKHRVNKTWANAVSEYTNIVMIYISNVAYSVIDWQDWLVFWGTSTQSTSNSQARKVIPDGQVQYCWHRHVWSSSVVTGQVQYCWHRHIWSYSVVKYSIASSKSWSILVSRVRRK